MVVGLSLAHSRGQGGYHGLASASSGHVASSVTGLYPWMGYTLSDRVSVWGVTGYGKGALTLTPGETAAFRSGLSMAMAAGGVRGELADSVVAGFGLAFKADALWVGTGIKGVDGPEGRLAATDAMATRFRTGLEASRGFSFQRGLSLQPSLELGIRRDGGDAETGAGVDIGGGLIVSDALTGLSADVRVRMLLAHQDEGFSERGMSIAFSFNPTPSTPLGFLAKMTPSWGGQATSGAQAALGPGDDGRGGGRRPGSGRPARGGTRLRDAGLGPAGRDAAVRHRDLRVRKGLPAGLRPDGGRERRRQLRAGHRCRPARKPCRGARGARRSGSTHRALVDGGWRSWPGAGIAGFSSPPGGSRRRWSRSSRRSTPWHSRARSCSRVMFQKFCKRPLNLQGRPDVAFVSSL